MKVEEIERLLAAFYEGKTTEDQEEALKSYFETQDVPEQFHTDRRLFLSFHRVALCPELPAGLDDKLSRLIDEKAEDDKKLMISGRMRRIRRWTGGVAATILLAIGLTFGLQHLQSGSPQDTFTDPAEAYMAAEAALLQVSTALNEGLDQLADSGQEIHRVNNEIIDEIIN